MRTLLKAGLLAAILLGTINSPSRAVDRDAVNQAIDKGVTVLRAMQGGDGTWPHAEIGATALAGLTLLECGAADDDRAVRAAANAVRQASVTLNHNYSIALAILFFDRLGDPGDIPLIESLTVRLLAGQTTSGGWNYTCPPIDANETRRLQTKVVQRKEPTGRRQPPKPKNGKRTAKDLPKEIQAMLHRVNSGGQRIGSDNSNTQFATLALWVARRYGLPVKDALKKVESRFRGSQHGDGGWGYFDINEEARHGKMAGSTASMTCAGLLGLAVADGNFVEMAHQKKPGGKPARDFNKDTHLRRGLVALGTAIGQPRESGPVARLGGRTFYFLWSLERVAVALDLKTIGKKDWYAWGAEILLANQQGDGSWQGNYGACGADTCFALLFLKRVNLAPDLTTQLTGKIADPGERVLKSGVAQPDEKSVALKSGLEDKDTKPPIEGRYPTPIAKPLQAPPAQAKPPEAKLPKAKPTEVKPTETKSVDAIATGLAADLVNARDSKQTQVLQMLEEGKGADFTVALALAVPKLSGDRKRKAREVLIGRLTRMTDKTLASYLEDEEPEIRRAAALACAHKESKSLIPRIVPLLRHAQRPVIEGAHEALKELTGEDFGPAADAGREERNRAAQRWLDWWSKQEHP